MERTRSGVLTPIFDSLLSVGPEMTEESQVRSGEVLPVVRRLGQRRGLGVKEVGSSVPPGTR